MTPDYDVVGIGNAIVDVLARVEDDFIARHGLARGSMSLVDADRAETIYRDMGPGIEMSGGSAANTIAGVASLGARGAFVGRVRDDQLGQIFRHDIRSLGVAFDTPAAPNGPPTGRCLVLVTPDAQRTMQTFLGAAVTLSPADVDAAVVGRGAVTYLEGYLWDEPQAKDAMLKAARAAKAAGRRVALTLSDPFCVARHRESFLALIRDHVDILFANEAEIISLTEAHDFPTAAAAIRGSCEIAALTRSEKGSLVVTAEEGIEVPAAPVEEVVDTTGAGDLYAAGFLVGLVQGRDLATCARIGGIAAAEVISHMGARPETPLAELVRRRLG